MPSLRPSLWRFSKDSHGQTPVGLPMPLRLSQRLVLAPHRRYRVVEMLSHLWTHFGSGFPSPQMVEDFSFTQLSSVRPMIC